jgi:hypothetical protein
LDIKKNNEFEIIAIEMTHMEKPILIISIYARPRCELKMETINDLILKYKETIILGDLNSTHKNWFCKNKNKNLITSSKTITYT